MGESSVPPSGLRYKKIQKTEEHRTPNALENRRRLALPTDQHPEGAPDTDPHPHDHISAPAYLYPSIQYTLRRLRL